MDLRSDQGSASSHLQTLKIANTRGPFPVVRAFEISQKPQGFFEMLMLRAGLSSPIPIAISTKFACPPGWAFSGVLAG